MAILKPTPETTESATNRIDPMDVLLSLAQKWVGNWRSTDEDTMRDDLEDAGLRIVRECMSCDGSGEAVADIIDGYHRYDICEHCGGTGIALDQFRILADFDETAPTPSRSHDDAWPTAGKEN